MIKKQALVIMAPWALVGTLVGCSSDKSSGSTSAVATGGVHSASGGASAGTTGGTSAMSPASGGSIGTGGAIATTSTRSTGGTSAIPLGSGGTSASGGTPVTTPTSTGGSESTTGGAQGAGGHSAATGGRTNTGGGISATGGRANTGGGISATGGLPSTGGAGTGGATSVDPSVSAAINACIDKLPYGGRDLSAAQRAPIVTAIINTCTAFAPPGAQWQTWCQMFLAAAINAESSYNTQAGATGAGSDPSVGLLQIRFTSVVRDFADYGPVDALTRIGCNFGTVTTSDTYATKSAMMLDVNCNIAIGAWYYFIFATGNGGSNVVWVDQYCMGGGVAGNLHIGMASFLMGGDAAHSSLSGADYYYNEIKSWFDPCVSYSGTHPFELPLQPDMGKYCR